MLAGIAASAAVIAGALQLHDGEHLRAANALVLAAILGLIASGAPERSTAAKWAGYALLVIAFALLGARLLT